MVAGWTVHRLLSRGSEDQAGYLGSSHARGQAISSPAKPILFLPSEFDEFFGQLSPDSHWMAFNSDGSGRREVYVRPFPPGEGEYAISIAGGDMPRWRGDGKELFFQGADGKMMAVAVKASTSIAAGEPSPPSKPAPLSRCSMRTW
jgi:hypothetical protein